VIRPACPLLRSADEAAGPPRAGRQRDEQGEKLVLGRTAQRGKGGRQAVGWAGGGRAPRKNGVDGEKGAPRWDRLSDGERRSWSAHIAATEALVQGLPALASPAQHRAVAAVLARGCTTGRADAPGCPGGGPLVASVRRGP